MNKESKEFEKIELDRTKWRLPECCRNNWENCPHVPQKEKKIKQNIGL